MTIKYLNAPPTEDGHYLLRVDPGEKFNLDPAEQLEVAVLNGSDWLPIGADYDYWQYNQRVEYQIEVIRKLDLKELAKG